MTSLIDHPAVTKHGSGVTSAQLASFTRSLGDAAAQRLEGVGDEQYSDGDKPQKFEVSSIDDYVEELIEEVADIFAYLSIIVIKVLASARETGSR